MSTDALSTIEKLRRENARLKESNKRVQAELHNVSRRLKYLQERDEVRALRESEKRIAEQKTTIEDLRAVNRAQLAEIARIIKAHAMRERYGK